MGRRTMGLATRKEEFLSAAKELFDEKGFESTSVEDIVLKVGVAKGLFYYYFESKDAILDALMDRCLTEMKKAIMEVAQREGLSSMDRMDSLLNVVAKIKARSGFMISYFHKPQNRYLHLDLERRGLEYLAPVMERIICQGIDEGIFHTDHPRETAIAYMATSSALGHQNLEGLTEGEIVRLVSAFQDITERLFGAEPGTFNLYNRRLGNTLSDVVNTGRSGRKEGELS